jgi:hypothetical protein
MDIGKILGNAEYEVTEVLAGQLRGHGAPWWL